MATVRIFQNPDGTVSIMRLNPRLTDVTFEGETAKNDSLKGLSFIDLDESELPTDRSNRDKWRVQGGKIKVDHTVPDKPHPKQALINRVRAANNLDQVKALLEDVLLGKNT